MNLVDCVVTRITGKPFYAYGLWWLDVQYNSWGTIGNHRLHFDSAEEAQAVTEGFKFLA
jgi:hypothetical protein